MRHIIYHCDYGHSTTLPVRLLPSGGDSNIITCQVHAERQIRAWQQIQPYTGPHWHQLRPVQEGTLPSMINTPAISKRIHAAAWRRGFRRFQLHYEHGQWWLTVPHTGAAWSVVDAAGGSAIHGFDFAQLTEGENA